MRAWTRNSGRGKRAKEMTRAGTGTWCAGSSNIGCAIETVRLGGLTAGTRNTPAQFLSEMFLVSGIEEIVARDGND